MKQGKKIDEFEDYLDDDEEGDDGVVEELEDGVDSDETEEEDY
jgi:hypothetical protein